MELAVMESCEALSPRAERDVEAVRSRVHAPEVAWCVGDVAYAQTVLRVWCLVSGGARVLRAVCALSIQCSQRARALLTVRN